MTIYTVRETRQLKEEISTVPVIKDVAHFTNREKAEKYCQDRNFRNQMYELEKAENPDMVFACIKATCSVEEIEVIEG